MNYLKVCCLIFKWFSCCLSAIDFLFDSIIIKEYTLYDLYSFKFVQVSFMTQGMVCLGKWSMDPSIKCCHWVEYFLSMCIRSCWLLVLFRYSILLFNFVYFSLHCLEWGFEVPNYNQEFSYFFFQFCPFLLHVLRSSVVGAGTFKIITSPW